MRRIALYFAVLGLAGMLTACEQDEYDKGEGPNSLLRADFVQVHTNADKTADWVVTDDGDSLALEKPHAAQWLATPDSLYRALLYYNKVRATGGDLVAQVVSLGRVTSAVMHRPGFFKRGVKTDPVHLESVWVGRNRRYLNLGLLLMTGSTDNDQALHRIGVVGDTLMTHADGTRTWHLRLYHDQGGVPEYYSHRTYFSLPLRGLDADSVRLEVNTYSGIVVRTLPLNR